MIFFPQPIFFLAKFCVIFLWSCLFFKINLIREIIYKVIILEKEKKNGNYFLKNFYPCGGGIIFMVIFFLMNFFIKCEEERKKIMACLPLGAVSRPGRGMHN